MAILLDQMTVLKSVAVERPDLVLRGNGRSLLSADEAMHATMRCGPASSIRNWWREEESVPGRCTECFRPRRFAEPINRSEATPSERRQLSDMRCKHRMGWPLSARPCRRCRFRRLHPSEGKQHHHQQVGKCCSRRQIRSTAGILVNSSNRWMRSSARGRQEL